MLNPKFYLQNAEQHKKGLKETVINVFKPLTEDKNNLLYVLGVVTL